MYSDPEEELDQDESNDSEDGSSTESAPEEGGGEDQSASTSGKGKRGQRIKNWHKERKKRRALRKAKRAAKKLGKQATKQAAKRVAQAASSETVILPLLIEAADQFQQLLRQGLRTYLKKKSEGVKKAGKIALYVFIAIMAAAFLIFLIISSFIASILSFHNDNIAPPIEDTSLTVVKTTNKQLAKAGELITYEILAISTRSAITNINITDSVPENTTFVSATSNPICDYGECNANSKIITWDSQNIPSATINSLKVGLTVRVKAGVNNVFITNKAIVSTGSTTTVYPKKDSNCVVTQIGNPKGTLPEGCEAIVSIVGVQLPPNLGPCIKVPPEYSYGTSGEYCQMPPSTNGSYVVIKQGGKLLNWGSKEMIGILYTVAQNWKKKYPQGYLTIGHITAPTCISGCHLSHAWGISVDLTATTNGRDCVAGNGNWRCQNRNGGFNKLATVELAKMFIDTGYYDLILFKSDVSIRDIDTGRVTTTITKEIYNYARSKYPRRFNFVSRVIQDRADHIDHFHLYISRENRSEYLKNWSHNIVFLDSQLKKCNNLTGAARRICFP